MSTPSHQPVLVLKRERGGEGGSEEEEEKKPGGCQWGSAIAHSLPAVGGKYVHQRPFSRGIFSPIDKN